MTADTQVGGAVLSDHRGVETRCDHAAVLATTEGQLPELLRCPKCGGDCLHHDAVAVFQRHEDEPMVRRTLVDQAGTKVDELLNSASGNPSWRRDGLTISLWCEACDRNSTLAIAQHKGQMLVSWSDRSAVAFDGAPACARSATTSPTSRTPWRAPASS